MHRSLSHGHGHCAEVVSAALLNELDLQTTGFELDHEITSKVLARGCRIVEVPIQYFPRSREEGKEDRREGLGQGVADVLAISSGMNATHAPRSLRSRLCSISAGTNPSVLEIVSGINRSPTFDGTITRCGDARHEVQPLRPAWRRQRHHVRPRAAVDGEQHAGIAFSHLQHRHPHGCTAPHPETLGLGIHEAVVKENSNGLEGRGREDCSCRESLARLHDLARTYAELGNCLLGLPWSAESDELGVERNVELALHAFAAAKHQRPAFDRPALAAELAAPSTRSGIEPAASDPLRSSTYCPAGNLNRAFNITRTGCRSVRCPGLRRSREQWRQFAGLDDGESDRSERLSGRAIGSNVSSRGNITRSSTSNRLACCLSITTDVADDERDEEQRQHQLSQQARLAPHDDVLRRANIHAAMPQMRPAIPSHGPSRTRGDTCHIGRCLAPKLPRRGHPLQQRRRSVAFLQSRNARIEQYHERQVTATEQQQRLRARSRREIRRGSRAYNQAIGIEERQQQQQSGVPASPICSTMDPQSREAR